MVAYYQPEMDTPKLSDKQNVGNVFREKWNITIKIVQRLPICYK